MVGEKGDIQHIDDHVLLLYAWLLHSIAGGFIS